MSGMLTKWLPRFLRKSSQPGSRLPLNLSPPQVDSLRTLLAAPAWKAYQQLLQNLYEIHANQILAGVAEVDKYHFQCGIVQGLRMAAEHPEQLFAQLDRKDKQDDRASDTADRGYIYANTPLYDAFARGETH